MFMYQHMYMYVCTWHDNKSNIWKMHKVMCSNTTCTAYMYMYCMYRMVPVGVHVQTMACQWTSPQRHASHIGTSTLMHAVLKKQAGFKCIPTLYVNRCTCTCINDDRHSCMHSIITCNINAKHWRTFCEKNNICCPHNSTKKNHKISFSTKKAKRENVVFSI